MLRLIMSDVISSSGFFVFVSFFSVLHYIEYIILCLLVVFPCGKLHFYALVPFSLSLDEISVSDAWEFRFRYFPGVVVKNYCLFLVRNTCRNPVSLCLSGSVYRLYIVINAGIKMPSPNIIKTA